jgi:hypothetical protein
MAGITETIYRGLRLIGFINTDRNVRIYKVEGNKRCKLRITPKGSNRRLTYLSTVSTYSLGREWKVTYKGHKFLSSKNLIYNDNI